MRCNTIAYAPDRVSRGIGNGQTQTIELLEPRLLFAISLIQDLTPISVPSVLIAHPFYHRSSLGRLSLVKAASGYSSPYGLTPAQIEGAYGVNSIRFGSSAGNGAGQTIAIVDAYDYPTALSDLNAFSSYFGLPKLNSGSGSPTFTRLSQTGSTSSLPGTDPAGPGNDWEIEESLDIEWAHAIAPDANIDLVEATSASYSNLLKGDQTAAGLSGVSVVSDSWGGSEFSGENSNDSVFKHSGVTFLFSSGDSGAYEPGTTTIAANYPACSPNVVAVGGTTLSVGSGNSYAGESAWGNGTSSGTSSNGGGGGGISAYESIPNWQVGKNNGNSSSFRTEPDVSLDANPNSGVPIYDTYDFTSGGSWQTYGGTSLACPMWGGLIAIANQGRSLAGESALTGYSQTLPDLYNLPGSDFHDVTSGNNGYPATTGYDLASGIGTPVANLLVPALALPFISSNPSSATVNVGTDTKFTAAATGSSSVQWMVEPAGASSFTAISGATSTTLDIGSATLSQSGNRYEAAFTNQDGSRTTATATLTVFPAWLSTKSAASWNTATQTLTVTGSATIIADPQATDGSVPNIIVQGSSASVDFTPSSAAATRFHLSALHLLNGASAVETALGASRSPTNHDVIVIAAGSNSLDVSGGLLDLADNDLIYDYAAGSGSGALSLIDAEVRAAFDGGAWNGGTGITSSAAETNPAQTTALGAIDNNDSRGFQYTQFDGESLGDTYEILVKYTYYGDALLEGTVDNDALLAFESGLEQTEQGNDNNSWLSGNFEYSTSGAVNNDDLLYFEAGLEAASTKAPTL